ncbi:hypothetical protein NESM_000256500 [Novymonas esmeraldas]|uniref:Uncharacterized protein n=1 Tax=Novymonas esmeraldas TaxID=1808958 RepID=A0AAW0F916_9TRYP
MAASDGTSATGHTAAASMSWSRQLSRATLYDIMEYTPHIPSICCAAAHPRLRYAREAISGTRAAAGSAHRRGDLYVCWDATTNREYHSMSGAEEELESDLRQMAWWLTRPCAQNGHPMIMEVNVKWQASPPSHPAVTEASPSRLESILRILTQSPFQRTDVGISCLRSLILTPNRLEVTPAAVQLLGQLTHLEKLESFTQSLALPVTPLESVYVLRLRNARSLTGLEPLLPLSLLRRISLYRCASLRSLAALAQLTELTELRVANCRVLDVRGDFSACRRLTSVSMRWCTEVLHIGDLATLPNLHDLDCGYSGLRGIEGLTRCRQLRRLCLRGCQSTHELFPAADGTEAAPAEDGAVGGTYPTDPRASLRGWTASDGVYSRAGVSAGPVQRTPTCVATSAASLPHALPSPLPSTAPSSSSAPLYQLEELDVGESSLVSLSGLLQCAPELRHLTVRECQQLHSLSPLGQLPTLLSVDASFSAVDELEGLSESLSLEYVNLKSCVRLRTAAPLARVRSLREIDLSALNQNCIICIDDGEEAEASQCSVSAGRTRGRRSDFLLRGSFFAAAASVGSVDDTRIDTAVTQRSGYGLLQHRIVREKAKALLGQPLEELRVAEARPVGQVW